MNTIDLHTLLHDPEKIHAENTVQLEQIVREYPYFQSVQALLLKGLYDQKSIRYNAALRKTAAYTSDRDVLFDFIVSEQFVRYKPLDVPLDSPSSAEENPIELPAAPKATPLVASLLKTITHTEPEATPPQTDSEEAPTTAAASVQELEEKLEIGQPLAFESEEKYSFQEWLQLAKTGPILREEAPKSQINDPEKQKKQELINKFIETNPKIIATKNPVITPVNIEVSAQNNSYIMTETLAKIYLEQKKYQKAIQAYEILILKYPEKSSFFADQIIDIKSLQQYNN
ncbi:tetratricopeptide repeat protein [Flavobacterium sp. JP2137]|uniref:tetratricopeptide repeat protein n=1 Tax=Flavobacterium sp. JP2137 TaxID=3414510 RepID=UPI003D2FB154